MIDYFNGKKIRSQRIVWQYEKELYSMSCEREVDLPQEFGCKMVRRLICVRSGLVVVFDIQFRVYGWVRLIGRVIIWLTVRRLYDCVAGSMIVHALVSVQGN